MFFPRGATTTSTRSSIILRSTLSSFSFSFSPFRLRSSSRFLRTRPPCRHRWFHHVREEEDVPRDRAGWSAFLSTEGGFVRGGGEGRLLRSNNNNMSTTTMMRRELFMSSGGGGAPSRRPRPQQQMRSRSTWTRTVRRSKRSLRPAERVFLDAIDEAEEEAAAQRDASEASNRRSSRTMNKGRRGEIEGEKETPVMEEVYAEHYVNAARNETTSGGGRSGGETTKVKEEDARQWTEGRREDGRPALVDFDAEPMFAFERFDKEIKDVDWDLPSRSLSPQEMYHAAGFKMWYLYDDRVVKMTAKGKKQSFRALVCVGNGNGTAGYGVGKADAVPDAYDRALMNARKNLIHLDLYKGCTLWEPLYGEWNNTKVVMKPAKRGHFRCSDMVLAVAHCFGINQLSSKIFGRKNPYIVIQAIFDAFQNFRTVEDMALARGKRMVDVHAVKYADGDTGAYQRT